MQVRQERRGLTRGLLAGGPPFMRIPPKVVQPQPGKPALPPAIQPALPPPPKGKAGKAGGGKPAVGAAVALGKVAPPRAPHPDPQA